MAVEEQVSIIPITFEQQAFIPSGLPSEENPGVARITIHNEVSAKGMGETNIEELKSRVYNIIETELIRYENESR